MSGAVSIFVTREYHAQGSLIPLIHDVGTIRPRSGCDVNRVAEAPYCGTSKDG
jgi:hypothetical protein